MMGKEVSIQSFGLSHKEFLILFWLTETRVQAHYPRELYKKLNSEFPSKPHSYDYLCKIAKEMEKEGFLSLSTTERKLFYQVTGKGLERLADYKNNIGPSIVAVQAVIKNLYVFLSGNGRLIRINQPLAEEHRTYFSKLVMVKDIIRYMSLKIGMKRTEFYMSEVEDQLIDLFGWKPSNSYLYHVAREMEENNLVLGRWKDDRRTKRFLKVTEEGKFHYHQIETSTFERIRTIHHYLQYVGIYVA
jgi:DNA-binding PadR family transcriptional regulator